ncbi:FliH/SctL family protein [Paenibacillus gansuensis]|uniref:FliH/SctL family protein n=1 Tax=Paenibacillus gansuensis TaxID=306542 RepID=A0ABW5PGA7_9BACL
MSNVIKPNQYVSLEHIRTLEAREVIVKPFYKEESEMTEEEKLLAHKHEEFTAAKEQMMREAEIFAQEQIREAQDEAERIKIRAQEEIDLWWQERRLMDEQHVNEAKNSGYLEGYQEGLVSAEANLREQYGQMLLEAGSILEQSHAMKQLIIQEAEPFLIELSTNIASKILDKQLTVETEWMVDLVKSVLARRREQGVITLCVSPGRYSTIQSYREELVLHIDSQAELQILPDASVNDQGCVVRTAFGSIDARIDTQLTEIKKILLQVAKGEAGDYADG